MASVITGLQADTMRDVEHNGRTKFTKAEQIKILKTKSSKFFS